jgi:hypothetical protein
MIRIDTRPMMLIAGILAISTIGCVTGTNTFSSATVPATRYCSIDDTPARLFDCPATAERSPVTSNLDRDDASGKVSLVP